MAKQTTETTPGDALMRQINLFSEVAEKLQDAINEITGSTNPEEATWADVSRFALLADRAAQLILS